MVTTVMAQARSPVELLRRQLSLTSTHSLIPHTLLAFSTKWYWNIIGHNCVTWPNYSLEDVTLKHGSERELTAKTRNRHQAQRHSHGPQKHNRNVDDIVIYGVQVNVDRDVMTGLAYANTNCQPPQQPLQPTTLQLLLLTSLSVCSES
ncbi:hypothetical protein J6590_002514 [Homalodisca vitripennis]|nr:hypothetical protein J6590_002514 [Homalodisca vitripennis]